MLLAEELSTGEWSPGNGHRKRQTRRITRNSEIEEAGDEAHSLQSDKQNHVTRIKDSIKVKRQKERSRTKL